MDLRGASVGAGRGPKEPPIPPLRKVPFQTSFTEVDLSSVRW